MPRASLRLLRELGLRRLHRRVGRGEGGVLPVPSLRVQLTLTFAEWGIAEPTIPHSPSPTRYQITPVRLRHRPFALEKNRPFGVCVVPSAALQSEQSSSRARSEPSPSQNGPAFLLPLPRVLGHLGRPDTEFHPTSWLRRSEKFGALPGVRLGSVRCS
jgi:hypothetical protein